jgi:hypothetical protein
MRLLYPPAAMSELRRRPADAAAATGIAPRLRCPLTDRKEHRVLWLIIGIILLIIAIAGGVVVHPILFVLAILALLAFFAGGRGRL